MKYTFNYIVNNTKKMNGKNDKLNGKGGKIVYAFFNKFQGCHTLREFMETQGIFKFKKISGKLREFNFIF